MDERGLAPEALRAELAAQRARDATFGSGRILGSMCTAPHPLAQEAYRMFLETNLGDPVLHAGARELEHRAVRAIGHLLRAPATGTAQFVSGGTEANFTALRLAAKATGRREVVLPASAHPSFDKALDVLGLTPRVARLGPDRTVDVDHVVELVSRRTACVVGIAGSTEFGTVDDVGALAELAKDAGAFAHVDAAFGGFVVPFLQEAGERLPDFDFTLPGVTTVTIDPHKMGMSCIPAGVLAVRDATLLDKIAVAVPYVSAERQSTLVGTRPGAGPAAAYAAMRALGREGYRANAVACLARARRLAADLKALGVVLARDPQLNVVTASVDDAPGVRRRLAEAGWYVAGAPLTGGFKVVVMPHVTDAALDGFLKTLPSALEEQGNG
ncbi:MAG TPA: tyrosine decarboxylase MfnA [Candidatus Thermoplasmatota archaeon]|nr:tyrosine decarboxylase MfnA [Candidatus Thermoplasmatota archaeon]